MLLQKLKILFLLKNLLIIYEAWLLLHLEWLHIK